MNVDPDLLEPTIAAPNLTMQYFILSTTIHSCLKKHIEMERKWTTKGLFCIAFLFPFLFQLRFGRQVTYKDFILKMIYNIDIGVDGLY